MSRYYLGMISGTSVDGVDAAICEFGDRSCEVIAARTFAYPPGIAERVQRLIRSGQGNLADIGATDLAVGRYFADCALALIRTSGISKQDIVAIGHHGQTIWHQPNPPEPFSWQIGDPNSIAAITGIDTVADLRRLDMAAGGQGAPLVPAFHDWLFGSASNARVLLNIGGIANLTILVPGEPVLGFDTGPGNTLLDSWTRHCLDLPYDLNGDWSASGNVEQHLLEQLLAEPYFMRAAPKSTGRELFNQAWLDAKLAQSGAALLDVNVAATILELSARSIADAIADLSLPDYALIACGGGVNNAALMARIGALTGREPATTSAYGLDPDYVEAAAMAWLARARVNGTPGNLPTVTAAREAVVLGGIYSGAELKP